MTERTTPAHAPISASSSPPALPGYAAIERLLDMQRKLYHELDILSASQGELIEQERTDELLAVLGQRQVLLTKIEVVNDSIAPARARWQEFLSLLTPDQRQRVGGHVDGITRTIEAIAERDRLDRERMQGTRDKVATEIAGLDRARRAQGAYGQPTRSTGALFQDHQA